MENLYQPPQQPQQINSNLPQMPEPPPKTFGWLKWVLIIAIVAFLSSGTTYFVLQSQRQTSLPVEVSMTPTPTPDPTANWKAYTNTTYGYSLKYPSEWSYKLGKGNETQVVFGPSPVETRTDVPDLLISVSEIVKQPLIKGDGRNKVIDTKQITIGEQTAEQATIADAPTNKVSYIQSAVSYKGKTYYFNLHALSQREVYDQILSTFRFDDLTASKFTCPMTEWVDCMPLVGDYSDEFLNKRKAMCSQGYLTWAKANCAGFQGAAY